MAFIILCLLILLNAEEDITLVEHCAKHKHVITIAAYSGLLL